MAVIISVVSGGSVVGAQQLGSAKSGISRITAVEGARYVLADTLGGGAAAGVSVKRVGKNLLISQDASDEQGTLIIEDFYGSNGQLVSQSADGQYHSYLALTDSGAVDAAYLSDGASFLLASAAAQPVALADSFQFAEGGSSVFSSALAGVAAVAGGFALSNNGSSGGSKAQPAPVASAFVLEDQPADAPAAQPTPAAVEPVVAAVQESDKAVAALVEVHDEAVAVGANAPAISGGAEGAAGNEVVSNAGNTAAVESNSAPETEAIGANGSVSALAPIAPFGVDDIPVIEKMMDDKGIIRGVIADGGYTDDETPTIMGRAEPGVKVHVYRGKFVLGIAVTDANGEWSYTPPSGFNSGTHSFTVKYEYADKQTSGYSAPYVITIDKVPPAVPQIIGIWDDEGRITGAVADQTITDDNRPTITGTAEAHATLIVYDKGKVIGSTTVGADGNWSFTPDTPLADGLHMLSYSAVDRAGNASDPTDVTEFLVDTRPEKINIYYADDDAGRVTGEVHTGGVTDDSTPTLFGTATAGGIVKIYEGSTLLGEVVADVDGTWQFTPPALSEGAHSFHATVTLVAKGESAPSKLFKLEVDLTAPSVPTIEQVLDDVGAVQDPLKNGDATDDKTPTLVGKADAGSTVHIYDGSTLLNSVVADASGNWRFTPSVELTEGAHKFTVTAVDKAGNASVPSEAFELTVVLVPPLPVAAPTIDAIYDDVGMSKGLLGSGAVTDDSLPLVSGKAVPNSIVVLKDNGVEIARVPVDASGNWSFQTTTPLSLGLHNLVATATDKVGNVGEASSIFGFRITELGGGGALENFNTLNYMSQALHTKGVVLPTGVVLTGTFGAGNYNWDNISGVIPRPEDRKNSISVNQNSAMTIQLPSESKKVSFFYMEGASNSTVTYFDANGTKIGQSFTKSTPMWDHYGQQLLYEAPEGKLIASIEIKTPSGGAVFIDALQWGDRYLTGISISCAEADGFGGRIVYGAVSGVADLNPGTVVQVSTDGGKTWTDAVFSEGSWIAIQKDMPPGDWTAEVRVVDRSSGLSLGFSDSKLVETQVAGAPTIERIQDAEGMYTTAKASDGSMIEVSLEGTGAKQGDLVHVRWGTITYDHVLTKANIDAGHASIRMPSTQILLQGVNNDFTVTAQIIGKNGTIGALSQPYEVTGTYVVSAAVTDTLQKEPVNNEYLGAGFKVTTDGVMTRTAATESTHAGLTLSDASQQANALFTLDKPARAITLRLSGIDSEEGVKIQWFDAKGKLIEEQTLYGDATVFHAKAFTYAPTDERVDVGSFRIVASESSVTLDTFVRKDVTHKAEARDPNVIDSDMESFFGTDGDDVVTLKIDGESYSQGGTVGIHGGGGIDTLKASTGALSSSVLAGVKYSSMEIIELVSTGTQYKTLFLDLSDVLRNGGTDIFYTGDKSRVQMLVKGVGYSHGLTLYDRLVGGLDLSLNPHFVGGDVGDWVKKGAVKIDGVKYDSYQHSTVAAEILIQQGIGVNNQSRPEFVDMGAKGAASGVAFDMLSVDVLSDSTPAYAAGDDQIIAKPGFADRLSGGAGNDTISNVGTGDTVHAGSGDDIMRINSTDVAQVNGGLGIDTLVMDGKAMHIDLSAMGLEFSASAPKVQGFEKFDLGEGGNTLSLGISDLLVAGAPDLVTANGKLQLLVNGIDGEVNLHGTGTDWMAGGTVSVGDVTYEVFSNLAATAELFVEEGVRVWGMVLQVDGAPHLLSVGADLWTAQDRVLEAY